MNLRGCVKRCVSSKEILKMAVPIVIVNNLIIVDGLFGQKTVNICVFN